MEVKFFGHFLIGRSGMGGRNSRYILGGWGWLDISYGWMELVGGIF